MKKLLVISAVAALGLSSVAFAGGLPEDMNMGSTPAASSYDTGLYLGIEGGYGITGLNSKDKSPAAGGGVFSVKKDNGVVGRAFLGYDLNRYFAVEGGYTYFFNKAEINSNAGANTTKTSAIDLMLKSKLPVVDSFDLYAKVGGNYLMSKPDAGDKVNNFNVAYGAGADYYVTSNVIVNLEWLRFNGKAKMSDAKYQPNTNAFMVGLRYKFDL